MKPTKPKTLEDFPKFVVTAVRRGPPSDSEYKSFEIEASYNPSLEAAFDEMFEGVGVKWFWLLIGESDCLCATLESFDKQTRTAILTCEEKDEPAVLGLELAYLSPYWQAFNVWMVLDHNWGWEKRKFQGTDAVAEDYEAKEVSNVNGREIKVWTKLEPVGVSRGQSRHYPATDQSLPIRSGTRLVPGAWGHEHCELCNKHIDTGMFGYCDPDERWMCEHCYDRYVVRHDLAFVDEL